MQSVEGKRIAALVGDGYEEAHLSEPRRALEEAGALRGHLPAAGVEPQRKITVELCEQIIDEELAKVKPGLDDERHHAYEKAASLMRDLIRDEKFTDFLTLPAYEQVLREEVFA